MTKSTKYVIGATLILSVVAIGVALFNGGKDGKDGRDGTDGVGGSTNFGGDLTVSSLGHGSNSLLATTTEPAAFREQWSVGVCQDATTTLFSLANPFAPLDAYVDRVDVNITSVADYTLRLSVGTSSSASHASSTMQLTAPGNSRNLIANALIFGTSSPLGGTKIISNLSSTTIANGLTTPYPEYLYASSSDITGGRLSTSTSGVNGYWTNPRVLVKGTEYLSGIVDDKYMVNQASHGTGGKTYFSNVISDTNAFECTYKARWTR